MVRSVLPGNEASWHSTKHIKLPGPDVREMDLDGWVEIGGRRLSVSEISEILAGQPGEISRFGGEFVLSWDNCTARDYFGIVPGEIRPGTIVCNGRITGRIMPDSPGMRLDQAIRESVRLRSDRGVCALSGGVDSSLIAALAGLPCIAIGTAGSHDLARARKAAGDMGLDCSCIEIGDDDIREGLEAVLTVLIAPTPVETALAISQFLIARSAIGSGHRIILSGQGADELFGGYARYQFSADLAADLDRDFGALIRQVARDQAVASLNGARFSLPYLDIRVVRAARSIPVEELVKDGIRKKPLREVAAQFITPEIAWYDKKALQYGSGVWKALQRFARNNGYKKSVQGYINQVITDQSDPTGGHDHDRREGR
jgi:asparagine synthase (glutamine-hydrolysing)